jgi:hypothetical protein
LLLLLLLLLLTPQLLEIALPVGFIVILLLIKRAVKKSAGLEPTLIEPNFPIDQEVFTPLTFTDYVTALQAKRTCISVEYSEDFDITGMPDYAYNWQVPMIKCDARLCQEDGEDARDYCEYAILAMAGADAVGKERATNMSDYILNRWPVLENRTAMRVDFDLLQIFDSAQAMNDYVRAEDYGKTGVPKIAMGIVWGEGNDEHNYLYSVRQNATGFNNPTEEGRPATLTTPDTGTNFESYAKDDYVVCEPEDGTAYQGPLDYSCTGQYLYNGVLTFQRLIGDYILFETGAAAEGYVVAEAGVGYVRFPSRAYEEEGFYEAISRTFLSKHIPLHHESS